jgi:hypothetical protein
MKLLAASLTLTLALVLECSTTTAHAQAAPPAGAAADASQAELPTGDVWRVIASPSTYHYRYNPDHRHVYMLGLERQYAGGFVMGASWFRNSFGQPSAYVYAGRRFEHVRGYAPLFVQLTGGVLYGYMPPYENKVPLNHDGVSPGAVLSVGWRFTPTWSAQVNVLGDSALMFQLSAEFR